MSELRVGCEDVCWWDEGHVVIAVPAREGRLGWEAV